MHFRQPIYHYLVFTLRQQTIFFFISVIWGETQCKERCRLSRYCLWLLTSSEEFQRYFLLIWMENTTLKKHSYFSIISTAWLCLIEMFLVTLNSSQWWHIINHQKLLFFSKVYMIVSPGTNVLPLMLQDILSVVIISHRGWIWMQARDAK